MSMPGPTVDSALDIDVDLNVQEILLAASQHDIAVLRRLLRANNPRVPDPVNVKDPETGYTPLHAAIAACEPEDTGSARDASTSPTTTTTNGVHGQPAQTNGGHATTTTTNWEAEAQEPQTPEQDESVIESGVRTVKFLLHEGAIWNDLDFNDETPGCLARRIGALELYELMVDAGVRAEILLNRLDEYELLNDSDNEEEDDAEGSGSDDKSVGHDDRAAGNGERTPPMMMQSGFVETSAADPTTAVVAAAANESSQLPFPSSNASPAAPNSTEASPDPNSRYLSSTLTISPSRILDADANGVMMSWESDLMQRSAIKLLPTPGLRVLNIGHGLGLIDTFLQTRSPSSHHIVEAHPAVLAQMKRDGWADKPGVRIHEGRWQEVLPRLVADEGLVFDALYYDTFAESYADFRAFFSEWVIGLLEPDGGQGRWGFFNGMGADRQISYDVYQKVVEVDLMEAGFEVEWEEVGVPDLEGGGEWDGVRRKYWVVDNYRLPTCRFMD